MFSAFYLIILNMHDKLNVIRKEGHYEVYYFNLYWNRSF